MIWQQTPIGYAVQFLVLLQPYLWMRIYDWDFHIVEWAKYSFYINAVLFAEIIYLLKAEVGYYNTWLIIQYVGMVMLATYLYNQRHDVKASICLAFLTVYLNSYYWELPLHIMEYVQGYRYFAQLVQLWRLFPLVFFFVPRGYITRGDLGKLFMGVLFSVAVVAYRSTGHGIRLPLQALHNPINRVVCLLVLIYVIGEKHG